MDRDGVDRPADRRSAQVASMLVPMAVGGLILVAVVGAAAHSGIRLSDRGPLADQRGPLIAIGILLLVVDILVIALIRRILRGRRRLEFEARKFGDDDAGRDPWWVRLLSYLIAFILIALPVLLISYGLRRHDLSTEEQEAQEPAQVPNVELPKPTVSDTAISLMVLISLAVIIVAAVVSYRQLHRRRLPTSVFDAVDEDDESAQPQVDERALTSAVDAGAEAIKTSATPREAIIACYAAMEATLAEHGSPRQATDTPAELLARAVATGLVRSDASQILTELFRRARFSRHHMGERDVRSAESALGRLRADLGVRA